MEKILKVLKKIESAEQIWQCEITRKIDSDGTQHIYRTHLRSISPLLGQFLSSLVLIAKPKTILELGCSGGYSALWMALGTAQNAPCSKPKAKIYTTEILKEKINFALLLIDTKRLAMLIANRKSSSRTCVKKPVHNMTLGD